MVKKSLEIHSENILPIIKRWLYSEKDIFVRELVSNSCDAIHKLKVLSDQGLASIESNQFRIDVSIDKEKKTLTFSDNGIGMDADEVQKYIARIAFSGAEEFLEKYKDAKESDQFIGHFGLGFYSSYMVADKVEIDTLSYKEGAEPAFWSCDGTSDYILEKGNRTTRGTTVTLFLSAEGEEFLEPARLREVLQHYCNFLLYPIYLSDDRINKKEPLWVKSPSSCTKEDYLEFYKYLYPFQPDPLFWVHLNVDYPFHLKGILYFPKNQDRKLDLNKHSVKLYCNRVFVSDNCKDLIPEYLLALQGVIDSPDIPLNVSRSYLQMDKTVRQLGSHISKKVADSLITFYKTEKERFIESWDEISIVVKLGAIQDEKFYERVKEILIWKTTDGEWMTVDRYLELYKEKTKDKIFYTTDETHHTQFIEIYKQKGIGVLCLNGALDLYLMHTIERDLSTIHFQRVDGGIDEHILDEAREKKVLDAEGKTEAGRLADFFRKRLNIEGVEVEAKSLAADGMPGFLVIDEKQRRMRDYFRTMGQGENIPSVKSTFVVNTNNPLIESITKMDTKNPELAKEMVSYLYQLAQLSQREMDTTTLNEFVKKTTHIMEKLSENDKQRDE